VAVLPAVIEYNEPMLAAMLTPPCGTMFPN
jgi:hypothetical protein